MRPGTNPMMMQGQLDYPELPPGKGRLFQDVIERVRDLAAKVKAERLGRYTTATNSALPTGTVIAPRARQTVEVLVPVARASLVVGPQGETLKRLEKMSGASITLDQSYVDPEERRFLVSGLPEDVDEAKRLIIDRPLNFSSYPSINISVPQVRVGLIIGKRGETIREIQEKSGAKVVVTPDMATGSGNVNNNRERIITVIGEQQAVDRAKDMIEEIVFGVVKSGASTCLQTIRNSAIMQIPDAATGAVIGKKAETMRGIQQVSGAKLFVDPQPIEGTTIRNVYISGSTEAMALAQQLICEKVRIVDPTFGYDYSGYGATSSITAAEPLQQQPTDQQQYPYQDYQQYQQPMVMDEQAYAAWLSQYYPQLDQAMISQYYAQYIASLTQQTPDQVSYQYYQLQTNNPDGNQ